MERQKAEIVQLVPDIDRVVATIAYVIHAAALLKTRFSQYDIVKTIFLADRSHLNEFGRLVSSDKYVAMTHGPVPSTAYNLLKDDEATMARYRVGRLPWRSDAADEGKRLYRDAEVDLVDDILSESDRSAIQAAASTVKGLTFSQIRKLTHGDPAYIDAWEESKERKQFPMSLGMMFDAPNFERARELSEMSKLR